MSDYIPSKDLDKIAWLIAFGNWLTADSGAHALAHGISLAQALAFQTEAVDAAEAVMEANEKQALARAATIDKDEVIAAAVATARAYAQKLQHDFTMTDADRAAAGITVPDPANTPRRPAKRGRDGTAPAPARFPPPPSGQHPLGPQPRQ